MGAIELKMALLSGLVGGVIMVLAEGVALHRKLSKYRAHLRELYQAKRLFRLFAEISGVALAVLIQPLIVSMLMMRTLDGFTPQYSVHAIAQLRQVILGGNLK
jgi:hypothetical protein